MKLPSGKGSSGWGPDRAQPAPDNGECGHPCEGQPRRRRAWRTKRRGKDGKFIKTKHVDPALPAATVITGMYRSGANELSIMRALALVVAHLERNYGLNLGKAAK